MPHPTEHVVNLRVQTTGALRVSEAAVQLRANHTRQSHRSHPRRPLHQTTRNPGEITAAQAVRTACADLKQVCQHIDGVFDAACGEFAAAQPQAMETEEQPRK